MKKEFNHIPVLLAEVLTAAKVEPGQRWIDGTFGRGGHSQALLGKGALVLGLDQDGAAEAAARALEARWHGKFKWIRNNFKNLKTCSQEHGWDQVDGILLDLGVSSPQLDAAERGFSFRSEGPLDMRMDQNGDLTADQVINQFSAEDLGRIFYEYGGEKEARRVARFLVERRKNTSIRTTTQLADLVAKALPHYRRAGGIHPATKVFQALRIAVNREEEALLAALPQAVEMLKTGGILEIISFHSGEDRVVKEFLRSRSSEWLDTPRYPNTVANPQYHLHEVKRYLPTEEEVERNPRARSARLRVGRRNERSLS